MTRLVQDFVLLVILCGSVAVAAAALPAPRSVYRSPFQLAFSTDGARLAVTDPTAKALVLLDVPTRRVIHQFKMPGRPAGVVWSTDGQFVYTANEAGHEVLRVDLADGTVSRLAAGARPVGLAIAPRSRRLLVANSADSRVTLIDLTGHQLAQSKAAGQTPYLLAITPSEQMAVVGNRLPSGAASDPSMSAMVTLVDLESDRPPRPIRLPPNSMNVRGIAISPDSRWAYAVHNLARAMLPTEQIEYGWINANALTVIDLAQRRRYATLLLDRFNDGAANPFAAVVSPDGSTLWITLAGVHQIGRIDLVRLHSLLRKTVGDHPPQQGTDDVTLSETNTARGAMGYSDSWQLGVEDPTSVELVVSDLPAEYGQGHYLGKVFLRTPLPGRGPRGLAVTPDGKLLAVALYFSGSVVFVDTATLRVVRSVPIGRQPAADAVRRGEMIFHDATYCFERWLSCSTCHPDGRADGLNWDLMNDGIGNPKNTRSLVWANRTPPMMSLGQRADMPTAAAAGFKFLLFQEPKADRLRDAEAYLRSLAPEPSPFLVDGHLSTKARRGQTIFRDPRVGCADCHPAPLYTDRRMHAVGTRVPPDESPRFDTPTLVELWRTAPYLHHGRAATLLQVLTTMNSDDHHGRTSHLSRNEMKALVEYLQSL
jgi:YVTN family beta-propeller protein